MTVGHPWGHGASSVRGAHKGELLDCGHKTKGKDDGALQYDDQWVCLACAVMHRCPICSIAGRNTCLDGTVLDQTPAAAPPPVTEHGEQLELGLSV